MEKDPNDEAVELNLAEAHGPVGDSVAPPATKGPALLPFHQRSWEDFEKIILVIAEHVDGMRGVRAYGVPGQRQHGIDLYGTNDGGATVGYQVKRVASFNAADLVACAEKFANGFRPVKATKLIVCVSAETDRTEVSESLEHLRELYGFDIDLYDQHRLSENLRTRPDLVRRLFGAEWAKAFCDDVNWPVPQPSSADILADALVRGPVIALGLESELNLCHEIASRDPATAAKKLAEIIGALEDKGFGGLALGLRLQRAESLISAEDLPAAVELLSRLVWDQVSARGTEWDRQALGRLNALTQSTVGGLASTRAFLDFVDAIDDWYGQPARGLATLMDLYQQLSLAGHPLADEATLWLLETALAVGDAVVAEGLVADVAGIVDRRSQLGQADEVTVRLRIGKAQVARDWDPVLRDARAGRLGNPMAMLAHARRAQDRSRSAQPEDADAEYLQAIHRACAAGFTAEAAAGLRSIVHVRLRFGSLGEDINELLRLAVSVEASSAIGLFPGRDPEDAGASALARGELPSALRWFRTALRNSAIRGDLSQEHAAHVALVDVLCRAGERRSALTHAIRAGSDDDAKKCMPLNQYEDVRHLLKNRPHWERATVLLVAMLEADLIPDDEVEDYLDIALEATQEPRRSIFGPHVELNAWKLVAALSERTTEDQAAAALDQLEQRIEREPNHCRHEDEEHVQVVVGVLQAHPSCAERASEHLAHIFGQGGHFADQARMAILARLRPPPSALARWLSHLADDGSVAALQTLGELGTPHPALVPNVRSDVALLLCAPEPPPGTYVPITALPQVARRARILDEADRRKVAEHCLKLALSATHLESNRTEGVMGIAVLARHLDDEVRRDYFPKITGLIRSGGGPTPADQAFLGGMHALSTMRFNLNFGSLPREALLAAAALALTRDDAATVVALAMERIVRTAEDAHAAALALCYLDPADVDLDLRFLLAHPAIPVRQLASVLAVKRDPAPREVVLALAADRDPEVRKSLATGLRVLEEHDQGLAEQVAEILCSDAHWSIRQVARRATQTLGSR